MYKINRLLNTRRYTEKIEKEQLEPSEEPTSPINLDYYLNLK